MACAERESDHVLVLSTKKGCWLRTVPAAAPEEQRKDEQDTYRMTDRKHDATGNAG